MSQTPRKKPEELRSQQWFGRQDRDGFAYRSWVKGKGVPHDQFDGRPVNGICNTFSELTPCNSHFRTLAEQVKIGVYEAGGFPLEFPVMSLGETLLRPTAMLYRNLASMDVEESIRGNPIDGVVLLMGCDKTTPSLLMGASSANLPTIGVSGGPMLNGKWRGQELGSGTGMWSMSEQVRAGTLKLQDFFEAESCMHRSHGHCMTMGTASTMASMVEALGIGLPGNATFPAVDGRRNVLARESGRRIVEMVHTDQTISQVLTREAFENAIRTLAAIGGSTNAVIHLLAIAGRCGVDLTLDDWDRLGRDVPTIVNLMPSGKYLMEEFFYAGGLPVVLKRLGEAGLLHRDALTVSGATIWDEVKDVANHNDDVILPAEKALTQSGGIDTEPRYSPDGGSIYFTSDRGGSPQIYRMGANGGDAQRVTRAGEDANGGHHLDVAGGHAAQDVQGQKNPKTNQCTQPTIGQATESAVISLAGQTQNQAQHNQEVGDTVATQVARHRNAQQP